MKFILVVLFLNTQTGAVIQEYNSYNECNLKQKYFESMMEYSVEKPIFACVRSLIK